MTITKTARPCIAALALSLASATLADDRIDPVAYGSDLAGANVSVEFSRIVAEGFLPEAVQQATIMATTPDTGAAFLPGLFSLTMSGNTYFDTWIIENLSSDLVITRVIIDLLGSASVFDDGSEVSTLGSDVGRPGVEVVSNLTTAAHPLGSGKHSAFSAGINAGDLFTSQTISWTTGDFGPGMVFTFLDDTDLFVPAVPAPGPMATLAMAGLLAMRRRR